MEDPGSIPGRGDVKQKKSYMVLFVLVDGVQERHLRDLSLRGAANFWRRFGDVVEVGWGGVRAPHWRGDWPINDLLQLFVGGADGPTYLTWQLFCLFNANPTNFNMLLDFFFISWHCSHFGSRYTLGCCGHAGLF